MCARPADARRSARHLPLAEEDERAARVSFDKLRMTLLCICADAGIGVMLSLSKHALYNLRQFTLFTHMVERRKKRSHAAHRQ